jgi:glycosyltransferase involved in cell wall biosynthesis
MSLISIIVPCYNETEVLPFFHNKILEVTGGMTAADETLGFEFLFINDGSKDTTLRMLKSYAADDSRFRYVSFSRNFGKEAAIYAGLCNATGDYIVILDADLQHPPDLIPEMYKLVAGTGGKPGEDGESGVSGKVDNQGESNKSYESGKVGNPNEVGKSGVSGKIGKPNEVGKSYESGKVGKQIESGKPYEVGNLGKSGEPNEYGEYDCAATRRVSRKGDSKLLSFFARSFYKVINAISNTEIVSGAQDFRFMTRQMADAILSMSEYGRFSKGIFSWVGFNTKYIEVGNTARKAGKSTWNFWKLFSYSIDGITGFSTAPLRLASILGVLSCIAAVVAAVYYLIRFIITGETAGGFYTLMCTVLLLGGLQLLCIGILGEYLSKTYLETKKRPIYIVKETNVEKEES